jgi:putative ABC transport system permease protein
MSLLNRLRSLFRRGKLESDLDDELKFHVEMKVRENIAAGLSEQEARLAALRKFGNVTRAMEETRTAWTLPRLESVFQDIRYGLRMLAKNPGFSLLAVLTLALGIGGTTAIFGVVYGALLNPWPYKDTDRLAVLVGHDGNRPDSNYIDSSNPSEFLDYQEQNHVFDQVIGGTMENVVLTGQGLPGSWPGLWVTPNTFQVLGVAPILGRTITPDDGRPGAPPVVVLSYRLWQKEFGGNPAIVGRTLVLNRRPTAVIGVMPPHFRWYGGGGAEYWFPASFSKGDPGNMWRPTAVIGRLKPGVTLAQASTEFALLAQRFASAYPIYHRPGTTFSVEPFTDAMISRKSRTTFSLLLGGVGILFLIACVNIANLLLARATAREKEIALRAALGAGRGRLVRQLMIESLILATCGAALGGAFASIGMSTLVAFFPPWYIPQEAAIRTSSTVLLFTAGIAILSTLLFGLAPAVLAVRKDLQPPLKESCRSGGESRGHHRLHNLLVVGEVALSLILLSGAGLLVQSFLTLRGVELGYNPDHLLVATTDMPDYRYKTAEQRNQFCLEILRRVRAVPGVVSAAFGDPRPVDFGFGSTPFEIDGKPGAEKKSAWGRLASNGLFETLGVRLILGRTFSEEDAAQARKVVVINKAFATQQFGEENPLGRQIRAVPSAEKDARPVEQPWFEIVGVVGDTIFAPDLPAQPAIYFPYSENGYPQYSNLFVRTVTAPETMTNSLRREVASLDKEMPMDWTPLRSELSMSWFAEPRFVMAMVAGFALLGMVLVCVGVYGVLSYSVSRRTHEIGVRMALGAEAEEVRRMVMMSGLRWLAIGIAIGVPASVALAKILQNRVWGLKSADPLTLIAVSLVLAAVGLAACYFPARRATKVDPMVALRCE